MTEQNNLAEKQEKTQDGNQSTEGGDKTPNEKKIEETGDKGQTPDEKKDDKGGEEMVQISKKELDKLQGKHNSKGAERRKSRKTRVKSDTGSRFSFEEPEVPETSPEEIDYQDRREFVKLKQGVADLILDSENYLKVVKADPTLKRILKNNPLALLDEVPVDAEDALEQITDILDDAVSESEKKEKKDTKSDEDEDKKETQPAPQQPNEKSTSEKKDDKMSPAQGLNKVEQGLSERFKAAGL